MRKLMKDSQPYIVSTAAIAAAVVMLIVLVFASYRLVQPRAEPFTYTQDTYLAERPIYAPGETLVYTASLTIERAGAIALERGWRTRPGETRARLCNGENVPVIVDMPPPFSPGAVGTEVEGVIKVVVPDLPPGDYWLISSISKRDGGESLTRVAVTVTKPC